MNAGIDVVGMIAVDMRELGEEIPACIISRACLCILTYLYMGICLDDRQDMLAGDSIVDIHPMCTHTCNIPTYLPTDIKSSTNQV